MSTIVKKVITTATIAIVAVGIAVPTSSVGAATIDELQAQINALLAQITQLQAQLSAQGGTPAPSAGACSFTKSLTIGSTGDDVKCLQVHLKTLYIVSRRTYCKALRERTSACRRCWCSALGAQLGLQLGDLCKQSVNLRLQLIYSSGSN